jgi:YHS domain-containing protein
MITLLLLACGSTAPAGEANAATVLAKADAHDGTTDHVVHECGGCGLGMPGDPAHAVKHEGYELHFCSETCKGTFEKDPKAGLAKIEGALK